ncbi:hypothetical protein GWK47_040982 [Chionoecetes opilio]|uniref:Uncharacterized protein n=1 Tax=Chionoecetes opilio TaxID=41210 RepID=A0A8J4YCU5_CHIOP|nr:hypothetical protein GWK47_040982 [Chionoecetes opilio]
MSVGAGLGSVGVAAENTGDGTGVGISTGGVEAMGQAGVSAIVGDTDAGVGEGSAADGVGAGVGGENVAGVGEGWGPAASCPRVCCALACAFHLYLCRLVGRRASPRRCCCLSWSAVPREGQLAKIRRRLSNPLDPAPDSVSGAPAPPHAGLVGGGAGTKEPCGPGLSPPPCWRLPPPSSRRRRSGQRGFQAWCPRSSLGIWRL